MGEKITTILFDLDGTLINTNDLIIATFLHTLGKYYPNQYKRDDILPFIGPSLKETFTGIDPDRVEEMILEYRTFNLENHDLLVKEYKGVLETVQTLKEKGYKLGIVTTKMYDSVLRGIRFANLEPFFDCIIALDHVTKEKPDPEPIFKALEKLDSKPEEAIMVGDNYHDILAGKNAGTLTAGVGWTIKGRDFLAKFEPDYMLENMSDLFTILGV